jgi:hypothetical protein
MRRQDKGPITRLAEEEDALESFVMMTAAEV